VRPPRPPWQCIRSGRSSVCPVVADTAIIMATHTRPGMNCHPMTVRCGEGLPSVGGRRGGACLCSAVHAPQTITGKGSTTGDGMGSDDHASRPSSRHRDRLEPPPLSVTHHGKAIASGQQQWSGDVPPTDHGPTAARQHIGFGSPNHQGVLTVPDRPVSRCAPTENDNTLCKLILANRRWLCQCVLTIARGTCLPLALSDRGT
jgi:hypothetical protein